ncbi:RibD family protein [Pararhodobacter sp. SW119]|uniref:RibD family protein n=1 Tax=Pararhodobacter sp. SW119 TaxID=2780075 RepID=UPI001AE0DD79|nr:RibD family protein [Pararhodobacter sp. SW119]
MDRAEVTTRVWDRILQIRNGKGCACCGEWEPAEKAALSIYAPLSRRDMGPQTVGQIGQSLDGRVATVAGDARNISGPDGLKHLHRLRAISDAVVIGVRTALHDNPRLTVRLCRGQNPARVVIDPRGRLPNDAPVFRDDGSRRVVVQQSDTPRPDGVKVIRLPSATDGEMSAGQILRALHRLGLRTILIEGGAITVSHFFEAGLLNRLHVAVAPLLIGGGPPGFHTRNPVAQLSDAARPDTRVFNIGSDIVFDCGFARAKQILAAPWHNVAMRAR